MENFKRKILSNKCETYLLLSNDNKLIKNNYPNYLLNKNNKIYK